MYSSFFISLFLFISHVFSIFFLITFTHLPINFIENFYYYLTSEKPLKNLICKNKQILISEKSLKNLICKNKQILTSKK